MLGNFLPDQQASLVQYGAAPVNLTYGLVSPEEVDAQKEEYTRSLEDQQEQAKEALLQQAQRQKEYLRVQAEQQKAIASGRWDQRLREQELAAEKQYQAQVARLNEAARQLKVALEYQVAQLLVEYDSRRTQEELNYRRYESELREWEECQHMSLTQIQHEEDWPGPSTQILVGSTPAAASAESSTSSTPQLASEDSFSLALSFPAPLAQVCCLQLPAAVAAARQQAFNHSVSKCRGGPGPMAREPACDWRSLGTWSPSGRRPTLWSILLHLALAPALLAQATAAAAAAAVAAAPAPAAPASPSLSPSVSTGAGPAARGAARSAQPASPSNSDVDVVAASSSAVLSSSTPKVLKAVGPHRPLGIGSLPDEHSSYQPLFRREPGVNVLASATEAGETATGRDQRHEQQQEEQQERRQERRQEQEHEEEEEKEEEEEEEEVESLTQQEEVRARASTVSIRRRLSYNGWTCHTYQTGQDITWCREIARGNLGNNGFEYMAFDRADDGMCPPCSCCKKEIVTTTTTKAPSDVELFKKGFTKYGSMSSAEKSTFVKRLLPWLIAAVTLLLLLLVIIFGGRSGGKTIIQQGAPPPYYPPPPPPEAGGSVPPDAQ